MRFRGSSKWFLGLHTANMFVYQLGHIMQVIESPDSSKPVNVGNFLACFMKVCETELMFTFMMHFLCILTISFGVFAALVGSFTIALPWLMAYVYSQDNGSENEEE